MSLAWSSDRRKGDLLQRFDTPRLRADGPVARATGAVAFLPTDHCRVHPDHWGRVNLSLSSAGRLRTDCLRGRSHAQDGPQRQARTEHENTDVPRQVRLLRRSSLDPRARLILLLTAVAAAALLAMLLAAPARGQGAQEDATVILDTAMTVGAFSGNLGYVTKPAGSLGPATFTHAGGDYEIKTLGFDGSNSQLVVMFDASKRVTWRTGNGCGSASSRAPRSACTT